jgi:hypothetical protein
MAPRTLDAYLTNKARRVWPGAQVWIDRDQDGEEKHILERPGEEPIGLGTGGIGEARRALQILIEDSRT